MTHIDRSVHYREADRGSAQKRMGTKDIAHVLAIGSIDQHNELHDLLLQLNAVHISALTDYSDLLGFSDEDFVQIAVLFDSISLHELLEATQIIRRKWPKAKIIVIRAGEEFLEDFQYDLRMFPSAKPQELLAQI